MNIPTVEFPKSLTDEEVEFLKQSNAIEGVEDYLSLQQAAFAWEWLKEQKKLTLTTLLKTHKILMLHQPLYPNEKGYFREVPVWVGGREGANWVTIRTLLRNWLMNVDDLIKNGKREPDIFKETMTKRHHVVYEQIHPFVDGNGRTGRMFMNWERLNLGLPLLIIHTGDEQRKYYGWFSNKIT